MAHDPAAAQRPGVVVARYGAAFSVEDTQGRIHACVARKNLGPIVCGDEVVWHEADAGRGVITALRPRRTLLARADRRGNLKPLCANIDRLVVVSAAAHDGQVNLDLVDRYLVAAEIVGAEPIVLLNKIDLLDAAGRSTAEREIKAYREIGYRTVLSSARTGCGIEELRAALRGATSVLVGESGSGKSTLADLLLPGRGIRIGAISAAGGGRHTTTATTLYRLPEGGAIIDSPGVRGFELWNVAPQDVARGFREFRALLGHCRFRDCRHAGDAGCAVAAAARAGDIAERRLESYRRIAAECPVSAAPRRSS